MADVDKHEIRTRLVLKDSEKQKYLLIRNEATGACMFPGETVRQGKTIEETAQRLFNQARTDNISLTYYRISFICVYSTNFSTCF